MSDVVRIRTFPSRLEAELARGLLEAQGIPASVSMDDLGGVRPEVGFIKGAGLYVDAHLASRALAILPPEAHRDSTERTRLNAQLRGCMLSAFLGCALVFVGSMVGEATRWLSAALIVLGSVLLLAVLVRGFRRVRQPPKLTR